MLSKTLTHGAERQDFFLNLGLTWFDSYEGPDPELFFCEELFFPYGLYTSLALPSELVENIVQANREIGPLLWKTYKLIQEDVCSTDLIAYGFPAHLLSILKSDPLCPTALRLDWCWNEKENIFKILEINSQRPIFMLESHEGNDAAAKRFGYFPPIVGWQKYLLSAFHRSLENAAAILGKTVENCHVAAVVLDTPTDRGTFAWLADTLNVDMSIIDASELELFDGHSLFDKSAQKQIDLVFFWHPIENILHDVDTSGKSLWLSLEHLILNKKVIPINLGSSLTLQPKGLFAFLWDHCEKYFNAQERLLIEKYIPRTALNPISIGKSYFAKPILGRFSQGVYAVEDGVVTHSVACSLSNFVKQKKVHQELLKLPTFTIEKTTLHGMFGTWLYNDEDKGFLPGGIGLRCSTSPIVAYDDFWLPVSCSKKSVLL